MRSRTSTLRLTHCASSSGSVVSALAVSVSLCRFTSVPMDGGSDAILLFDASTLRHLGATSAEKILAGKDVRRASRRPTMPVVFHASSRCDALRATFWDVSVVCFDRQHPMTATPEALSTARRLCRAEEDPESSFGQNQQRIANLRVKL